MVCLVSQPSRRRTPPGRDTQPLCRHWACACARSAPPPLAPARHRTPRHLLSLPQLLLLLQLHTCQPSRLLLLFPLLSVVVIQRRDVDGR